jgi:glycosyltransferase involved in cell wall biosynthesis
LNVCIFTTVHRPTDVRVFHREARTLAAAGHSVTLLAHGDFVRQESFGVIIKGIPRARNRFFRLLSIFKFAGRCLKERAEVYHFHDLELLPLGVLLKWITGKRVIYDCHENYPEAAFERAWYPDWLKPWVSTLIAAIEPALARRLDIVICVVPDQQQRFEEKGCRTLLLRNLPRLEIFASAFEKKLPKLNRLIYLGGMTLVRGAKLLVDIMVALREAHPQVKLLCLGPFNEPHVETEVKQYAGSCGLSDAIEYVSSVPHEKVPDYLAQSQVGLIPWQPNEQMLRMVFPNKVFEYMACGLPAVASDLPSLRYIFGRSQSGLLVRPDDPKAHAQAIRELLDHPALMAEMGAKGRRFVTEQLNWDKEAVKLVDLYQQFELLNSGGEPLTTDRKGCITFKP